MRISRAPLSLFLMRFVLSPACENRSESITGTANKLPFLSSGIVSPFLALDPRLLVQYKHVHAHIRDFPGGVHIASSACLDSKASLPIVLDV